MYVKYKLNEVEKKLFPVDTKEILEIKVKESNCN